MLFYTRRGKKSVDRRFLIDRRKGVEECKAIFARLICIYKPVVYA